MNGSTSRRKRDYCGSQILEAESQVVVRRFYRLNLIQASGPDTVSASKLK